MADAVAIFRRVTKKFYESCPGVKLDESILLGACVIAEVITNGISTEDVDYVPGYAAQRDPDGRAPAGKIE